MDGDIEVVHLLYIKQIEQLFAMVIKEIPSLELKIIRNAIHFRLKELYAFKCCLNELKEFVNLCNRFSGNLPDVADLIFKSQNYKEFQICELYRPKHIKFLNKLENIEQYYPEVTAFNLPSSQLKAIFSVVKSCKGDLFLQLWDVRGQSVSNEIEQITGIDKIIENVLLPTMRDWQELHNELVSGTITFREFEKLCGKAGDQDVKELLSPFEYGKDCSWIHERIIQMSRYRSLHTCLDAAKIIRDIVEMYDMDGDFETVKRILIMASEEDCQMKNLSREHLKSCDILLALDSKKVECLKKFRDSKPLVDWIRDKMKDLRELKVFIDLAYISTGDDPWEISRSHIFSLRQLEDTCRQLDWLKQIEEIRGSIEMTSLAQAKSINASGTYTIGNLGNTAKQLLLVDVGNTKYELEQGRCT
ncbi:RNF213 [Mytilus edulis]|uniref:RNF213 n=1 Tax=Mytilus edulis TaxID=6550 RepID=A0A8S3QK11_MYTED|nr:RNF213 [Mytilus edulis]